MKKFWDNLNPTVKATIERMWRGGLVAVVAAYAGGVIDLNGINPDTIQAALGIFVSGAVASLLLALGISASTGTGPALNKGEQLPKKAAKNQGGAINIAVSEILLFVLTLVVVLWWFGVRPG